MKIDVKARSGLDRNRLADFVQRRVSQALRRYRELVEAVEVRLQDVNGPRGGADIDCLLSVRVVGIPTLRIRQVGLDPRAAVTSAAHRMDRAVARSLARRGWLIPHRPG